MATTTTPLKSFNQILDRFDSLYEQNPDAFRKAIDELNLWQRLSDIESDLTHEDVEMWGEYVSLLKSIVDRVKSFEIAKQTFADFWGPR
jgi:hypothetical protein